MNAEEEELKAFKAKTLRSARITPVILGLAAVIVVLFMIYGFTQSIEAARQKDLAANEIEKATRSCNS